MTHWLPDHDASQPEPPEEVSALQGLAAALHSKCMASDQFMATIQQEAARMTAKQAEQLQVFKFCAHSKSAQIMPCVEVIPYFPNERCQRLLTTLWQLSMLCFDSTLWLCALPA